MKDVLKFKNVTEMMTEADEFLAKITDCEIKACSKFLLLSCYAYINEYVTDDTKKSYGNLATLVKYELLETEYIEKDGETSSKLTILMKQLPNHSVAKKVYQLYLNCDEKMKKYAQMRIMEQLLPFYAK